MNGIRIVSDGTVFGTKVYDEQGNVMGSVSKVEIDPLDANDSNGFLVTAKLTFVKVALDLKTGEKTLVKEEKIVGGKK